MHLRPEKLYATVKAKYFWRNMYRDCYEYARTCEACQAAGKGSASINTPLKSLPIPEFPLTVFHIDYLALPRAGRFQYCLVCICSLSLWCVLIPTVSTGAEECARVLFDRIFMEYGAEKNNFR